MPSAKQEPSRSPEWQIAAPATLQATRLIESLRISPMLAQLLINRGIDEPALAQEYLEGSLADIPSPQLLTDMDQAVARVVQAIERHERICVYGDYDLDGISASTILYSFLLHYRSDVQLFIPHRERDGYGLQRAALDQLARDGVRLIITCDNGTSAHAEIAYAAQLKMDVVVTDHHSLPEQFPPAVAILNPMRPSTPLAFRALSGTGVAFMLVLALRRVLRDVRSWIEPPNLKRMLDLVTLGTVADIVPLVGVNRVLVREGLDVIASRRRPGIKALLEVAGVEPDEAINTITVGYRLAPRLNAAGRLEDARLSVDVLMTEDMSTARRLAQQLEQLNRRRQTLEEQIVHEMTAQFLAEPSPRASYVFASDQWHHGVVGVAASRLVELTHRPGIVLAIQQGEARGSGRSLPGIDLVAALRESHDVLVRYGGHQMAAGMTLRAENLGIFRDQFEQAIRRQLEGQEPQRILKIDAELPLQALNESLLADLARMKPFGPGNREPVFCTRDLTVQDMKTVGRGHLRMRVSQAGTSFASIGFRLARLAHPELTQRPVSIAYHPEISFWRGNRSIQLRLCDLRAHGE